MTEYEGPCPFDVRLARMPYLVLPKLAIQAMPMEWRKRLEDVLKEADEAGLETPSYLVFRDDDWHNIRLREDPDDQYSAIDTVKVVHADEWANYRYGKIEELCPNFKRPDPKTPDSAIKALEKEEAYLTELALDDNLMRSDIEGAFHRLRAFFPRKSELDDLIHDAREVMENVVKRCCSIRVTKDLEAMIARIVREVPRRILSDE